MRREEDRLPAALQALSTSQTSRRACGSSPVVGSSRNTISGSLTSAMAIPRRCLRPPESVLNWASALSLQIGEIHQGVDVGPAAEHARVVLQAFAHRDPVERAEILRKHADPADDLGLALA